ncbi:MAG: response regulator transcription factor [Saprospiraceae bacterium]|nr:response regulator transcription factor [Saprospiraceae bacterium]
MVKDIKVLIVEDELQNRLLLKYLLKRYTPEVTSIFETDNIGEARDVLSKGDIRILFLDIHLKGENGFSLLDSITEQSCEIIFVTADRSFAVKAFKYSALDYLIKPIDESEFKQSILKAVKKINRDSLDSQQQLSIFNSAIRSPEKKPERITIPTAEGIHFVRTDHIIYCQSDSNYTQFVFNEAKKILSSHHLGYYSEILEEIGFVRVHRSFIVNPDHIQLYKRGDGGTIIMSDRNEIDVSRAYKSTLLRILKM